MTLEEQKASQKKTHLNLKKTPQNKHLLINPKYTAYEKGGKTLADVILKELASVLVKARCGAQQMEGDRRVNTWSRFDKILACSVTTRTVSGVWSCWHKEHTKQDQEVMILL